ncbi:9117_t:CDS:2 [Paraglomus brasilianum]|uniref:9117_t:CDS:1 n=1 Tax=Paraglomus brasilianum TaxID=144538 RepID=A0A9N9ANW6_9GLOM|nr:9117_t:CDS:2 [Paraglomus brasilianum]
MLSYKQMELSIGGLMTRTYLKHMIKLLESENFEAATNDVFSDLTKTHHGVVPIAHPKIQCHKELDDNGINTTSYIDTDANMPLRIILSI